MHQKSEDVMRPFSPHIKPMPIVPKKVFAGVLSPMNSTEAAKSYAPFFPTHYPNAEGAKMHFRWCDVNIDETPNLSGYAAHTSGPAEQCEID